MPDKLIQFNVTISEKLALRVKLLAVTYGLTTGEILTLIIDHVTTSDLERMVSEYAHKLADK